MGDGGRQLPQGRHPVRMRQLQLASLYRRSVSRARFARLRRSDRSRKRQLGSRFPRNAPRRPTPECGCRLCGNTPSQKAAGSGRLHLVEPQRVGGVPLRRRQVRPAQAARNEILTLVSQHAKKGVVRINDVTCQINDRNSDNVGVNQSADFCFSFLKIAIKTRVLQRDGGLRRQQFQDGDASRGECVRRKRVFEVENPG